MEYAKFPRSIRRMEQYKGRKPRIIKTQPGINGFEKHPPSVNVVWALKYESSLDYILRNLNTFFSFHGYNTAQVDGWITLGKKSQRSSRKHFEQQR